MFVLSVAYENDSHCLRFQSQPVVLLSSLKLQGVIAYKHNIISVFNVFQIQVYPKNNAPGVWKPQRVVKSDFLLILKIFLTLDDIRPSN